MPIPELSSPKDSIVGYDHEEEIKKEKIKAEEFLQQLFDFFQRLRNLFKGEKLDLDKSLKTFAQDHGYNDQEFRQALNTAKNAEGQTALTQTLQQQDFSLANTLLNNGAQYDAQSREEYDIAIHSKPGAQALSKGEITPPQNYKSSAPNALHPMKEFGLVLGVNMTSTDGVSSQRAHVGPTYKLMTNTLKNYKSGQDGDFNKIATAFQRTDQVAKYEHSTAKGSPEAGKVLSDQIQKGELTSVPINCKGHAMGLSFVPVEGKPDKTYLVFTDRGNSAGPGKHGTHIYEVNKKDVTPDFLNKVMNGHDKGLSHQQVMGEIGKVTQGQKPVKFIPQKAQKYDNCTIANPRANVRGVLECLEANRKGGFEHVNKEQVDKRYKDFTGDMRSKQFEKLEQQRKEKPDPNLDRLAEKYVEKSKEKASRNKGKEAEDKSQQISLSPIKPR